jgi:hypothetical protein
LHRGSAKLEAVLHAQPPTTRPACSTVAARAAIRASKVVVPAAQSISSESFRVSPDQADGVICLSLPGSRRAMIVPIASGGTAGDIGWIAFVAAPGGAGYRVSLVRGGYKLGLIRKGADLVETDPVYRANDANCCPSGGFDHARWHWNGRRFAVVRSWHDGSYQP